MTKNTSKFKVGDKVTYSGFDFTVIEVCAWANSMICIRGKSGVACVDWHGCLPIIAKQYEFEDRFTRLSLNHDRYYHAYHELKNAAIALVQRLELDKDVKKNNWWLNEREKILEVIDDNDGRPAETGYGQSAWRHPGTDEAGDKTIGGVNALRRC